MFRRIIASLLLIGYLAGQLATMPHAHAAWDAEHEKVAHIHGGWFTRWFDREGHSHGCSAHCHRGQSAAEKSETSPQEQPHDHDCILLPQPVVATPFGKDATTSVGLGHLMAIFSVPTEVTPPSEHVICRPAPPNESASPLALYLTLRTLRI